MAHSSCNLRRSERHGKVPIYAHNLQGFDGHIVLSAIGQLLDDPCVDFKSMNLEAISTNSEKMRSIQYRKFVFLDSLSFLDASLEKVVADLKCSNHQFPILRKSGLVQNEEQLELISSKGIFPYSRLTDLSEFESLKELPPIEEFYNDLSSKPCSQSDYERAKRVFEAFKCSNMGVGRIQYDSIPVSNASLLGLPHAI